MIVFDDMIVCIFSNKKPNQILTELSARGRKLNMFLLHNLIFLYQKILDYILHTVLLWKFQTNKSLKNCGILSRIRWSSCKYVEKSFENG